MSVCNIYDGNKWIPIEESKYCPIYTSQEWPNTWYKWLCFYPQQELEKMVDIFIKKFENITEEEKNIIKTYRERKRIASLIYNHNYLKYFTYYDQKEVEQYTKEHNINDLIDEKLSYFKEKEREKIKEKVLKGDN